MLMSATIDCERYAKFFGRSYQLVDIGEEAKPAPGECVPWYVLLVIDLWVVVKVSRRERHGVSVKYLWDVCQLVDVPPPSVSRASLSVNTVISITISLLQCMYHIEILWLTYSSSAPTPTQEPSNPCISSRH